LPQFVALVWPVVALGYCCPGWMDSCVSGNYLALDFECAAKSLEHPEGTRYGQWMPALLTQLDVDQCF
jgi:hypothetical protein